MAMPTYQYVCEKCGHEFELFQSMADKALTTCPREFCAQESWGKGKVKRMIGPGAGLIFKGSGFYITDYRSKSYQEAAKRDSSAATTPSGDGKAASSSASGNGQAKTAKTESKPAKT